MAISIDWKTKVITVPQADLTPVSGSLYDLDTDAFRLDLKALESTSDGMAFERTHRHNTQYVIVGVTYARAIEIINDYSIEFEDTGSLYSVRLVGSNNNFFDIQNGILVQNLVQVIPGNSAGLQMVSTGSGLSTEEHNQLMSRPSAEDILDEVT